MFRDWTARRHGTALAWSQVGAAAARDDAPAPLRDAVAKANGGFFGLGGARLQGHFDTLDLGRLPEVTLPDWTGMVNPALGLLGDVANAALDEMVAEAHQAAGAAIRTVT